MEKVTYQDVMEEVKQTMLNDFIKCRIKCEAKYHETDTQLGYGSVIIDQQIRITGIRLMKSQKNPGEVFLSMPRQKGSQGEYFPVCILEPQWQKAIMTSMIIDIAMQQNPLSCPIENVEVRKYKEPPLCAFADVTVNGITIYGVKLLYLNNKYICKFPQVSISEGNKDIVYPMKGELRNEITEAVVKAYQDLQVKKEKAPDQRKHMTMKR